MAKTLKRAAAFTALARALTAGTRGGPTIAQRLGALPRMIAATVRGRYDGGARLALMVAATAYVVSPVDAVPEMFLVFFGLIDDTVAVTWLAGMILSETERFLEWERTPPALVVE
ncbi:hypothetical protein GCM10010112_11770 [Actinoplanes lobatus]|uniref:Uncharacterized membrane protein YkvA (DUF1232 family) n=1 Tax=Actinoplanes lobatus TaxID=113568 RepID=A0A7W7HEF9_9ACTN|nr:YkvA family protein [Actinoplanes lobatus]MBB4748642.1 uncharacterized membrane protein YkvA (DUF1232 family) [Actinoplanes lobatus]GGN58185.1 hypothetical protein GCM10010112_11770 [Actinoplanes lobatus]GIE37457.1 hypothetical protein Alo02nite_03550 [Actinoplanes lobatus]